MATATVAETVENLQNSKRYDQLKGNEIRRASITYGGMWNVETIIGKSERKRQNGMPRYKWKEYYHLYE
jgi:hypothetical protein